MLIVTFAGSYASVLASRGIYFFLDQEFEFTETKILWLALGAGITYTLGALPSHWLSVKLGERNLLAWSVVLQLAVMVMMYLKATPATIVVGQLLFQFFNGFTWPVVETYISAGRTPAAASKSIGQFNVTWALTVPLAVQSIGPALAWMQGWGLAPGTGLFGGSALCFLLTLLVTFTIAAHPHHIEHDDPRRPEPDQLRKLRALMISSRWLLLYSYALFFLLNPLMSKLFGRMGHGMVERTQLASVMEWGRVAAFIVMQGYGGWKGRSDVLVVSVVLIPVSFVMILIGATEWNSTGTVVAAELVFGGVEGVSYYAALYYAMVVKNASVDAGGAHEGLDPQGHPRMKNPSHVAGVGCVASCLVQLRGAAVSRSVSRRPAARSCRAWFCGVLPLGDAWLCVAAA